MSTNLAALGLNSTCGHSRNSSSPMVKLLLLVLDLNLGLFMDRDEKFCTISYVELV